jgi:hypothetical protein
MAIDSPLLETSIEGARGVLFNVTGGRNMSMHEIDEAAKTITDAVDPDANIIFGAVLDNDLDDDILITVVATGFDGNAKPLRHEIHHHQTEPQRPLHESAAVKHEDDEEEILTPIEDEEPAYVNPVVLPGARKSFIDEPPQTDEPDDHAVPPRRFAPVSSIEPDDNSHEEVVEEEKADDETKSLDEHSPNFETTFSDDAVDDDLDVPAFIRRKVD